MTESTTRAPGAAGQLLDDAGLRQHVAALAAQPRETATPGGRAPGGQTAGVLEGLGLEVGRDAERVHGTYWWPIGLATGVAGLAGAAAPRALAAVAGAAGALATTDDVTAGPRLLRRLLPHRE